jgi:hypothetical protein
MKKLLDDALRLENTVKALKDAAIGNPQFWRPKPFESRAMAGKPPDHLIPQI